MIINTLRLKKKKIYNNKIKTNFYGNKIPEDNEYCTCLSVILLDSVVKISNVYYQSIFRRMQICNKKEKCNEFY